MGFSRQEYWDGLSFPSPGDLPNPGISPESPTLQSDSLPTELQGKPMIQQMLVIRSLVPLPFYIQLNIWKFSVYVLLKTTLNDFEHILLACEMSATVQ